MNQYRRESPLRGDSDQATAAKKAIVPTQRQPIDWPTATASSAPMHRAISSRVQLVTLGRCIGGV